MNDKKREQMIGISNQIANLKELLENIMDEEGKYQKSIPISYQNSSRFITSKQAQNQLYGAVSHLKEALDCLENAQA